MLLGQRCGKRELQILQHNNEKIQVSPHGPPYLYLYALWRVRIEDKVVTIEGVSCITTQTTRISKYVFFWHFQEVYVGCKYNSCVHEEVYVGWNAELRVLWLQRSPFLRRWVVHLSHSLIINKEIYSSNIVLSLFHVSWLMNIFDQALYILFI